MPHCKPLPQQRKRATLPEQQEMPTVKRSWLLAFAVLASALGAAATPRSAAERAAFKREHPCPTTGQRRGPCPGHVIDHIHPLCAGGPDHRGNMQWQTIQEGRIKDRWERSICRGR